MDPDPHGEWVRVDALREALYRVVGSMTDARLDELMRAAAVPLHGHPIHNAAGYIAAILRADMKEGIDAALTQGRPTDE
jgi:hypothetical protein